MNTNASPRNHAPKAPGKLDPAPLGGITKIALVILFAGAGLAATAQLYNLDFEMAHLVPATGDPWGRVQFGPAFPGWTGYCGTAVQTVANYNNEFLDSAGISILDTNCTTVPLDGLPHGRYCALIQSGLGLGPPSPGPAVDASIAQTGIIPAYARSIILNAGFVWSGAELVATFNGTPIPLAVMASQSNYLVLGGDVGPFAGQTGELRFTRPLIWYTNAGYPYGTPTWGPVLLDYIRFSTTPLAAAPVILEPPLNQAAPIGSAVKLVVYATAHPAPVYQWWFNATNAIDGATNSILALTNLQWSQIGIYTVVITNVYGVVTSPPALVRTDPCIPVEPQDQSVNAWDSVLFSVQAWGSWPALDLQWFKNGALLNDGRNISGARTATLTISNVFGPDAGGYSVRASNAYGSVTSRVATLTVRLDPLITSQPASQTVSFGGTASFTVGATGTPPLSYQWVFNGGALSGARGSNLQLTNVQLWQAGTYKVVVTNLIGVVTSAPAALSIIVELPIITNPPVSQTVIAGESVEFAVRAAGWEPLSYQWLFNSHSIGGANLTHLQLTNVQLYQAGAYRVIVSDVFGAVTSAPAQLTIAPLPAHTVLHEFGFSEGVLPWGTLAISDGVLYGTAVDAGWLGYGTVFKLNTNGGGFTVLRSFAGGSDGAYPLGGVAVSGATVYGTTSGEGAPFYGTVFRMNANGGSYSVLHQLTMSEGRRPWCKLLLSDSTLYGTAQQGGSWDCGSVFKLSTDGSGFTVLKQFMGSDGAYPVSELVLSGTTLYGATDTGGSTGNGVVFAINTDGTGYRLVKDFSLSEGSHLGANLALSGSVLFGTTFMGGSSGGGTVFKVNTDGTGFSVLKSFTTNDAGVDPRGGLVLCGRTLYGTLAEGGQSVYGAVYKLNADGSGYGVLKRFSGGPDGALPYAGVVISGRQLYGTTQRGGRMDDGTVFVLSLPIPNIITPPMSQTAELGATAVFRAETAPDPSLICQWFFNGTNAVNEATTNSFLCLRDVQFSQTGDYCVMASNTFGVATSAPAKLKVIPPVERRLVPALALTGQAGSAINLEDREALGPTPGWASLDTLLLTNAPQWYFDLSQPAPPQRFYRAWQTGVPGVIPSLDLHMVTALTLTGNIGQSLRLDYINQFGPIDAWVNLATVTLTNTSQLYFDVTSFRQPGRLYRIVPMPSGSSGR